MKINEFIAECTTSGSVAPVAQSMFTMTRNGNKKAGSMFKGKTTKKPFYEDQVDEAEINEEDKILAPGKGRQYKPGLLAKTEPSTNPTDTVKLDVPLLIRLLEYAREDASTDMDLHDLAEKLVARCSRGKTLTMKDYDYVVETEITETPMREGAIKDAEQALERHAKRRIDREQSGNPYVPHEEVTHNKIHKQLLQKKRRAQQAYTKKMDSTPIGEGATQYTVYCSQCGGEFKRNNKNGFSHCKDHAGMKNYDLDEGSDYTSPKLGTVKANIMHSATPTVQVQVFKHNTLRGDSYWVTKEVKTFKTMDQAKAYAERINKGQ